MQQLMACDAQQGQVTNVFLSYALVGAVVNVKVLSAVASSASTVESLNHLRANFSPRFRLAIDPVLSPGHARVPLITQPRARLAPFRRVAGSDLCHCRALF
jgi:hypothetical protein